jgi:uncharacterized membrane-anchored protein
MPVSQVGLSNSYLTVLYIIVVAGVFTGFRIPTNLKVIIRPTGTITNKMTTAIRFFLNKEFKIAFNFHTSQ